MSPSVSRTDEGNEHTESVFHHQNEVKQKFEINPQVYGRLLNYLSIHAQVRKFLGRTSVERVLEPTNKAS